VPTVARERSDELTPRRLEGRRVVQSTRLVEEPISSELVLVDRELALRARVALPDPPWLLPVLAELKQAEVARRSAMVAAPRSVTEERFAPAADAARRHRRSLARHIGATVASVCLLFVLADLADSAYDLLSTSQEPTFVTTPVQQAAAPMPTPVQEAAAPMPRPLSALARARRKAQRSEPRRQRAASHSKARRPERPKVQASPKSTSATSETRTKPGRIVAAPKPTAKATPRALGKTQRVFSWPRQPAAVYYQFSFQRGGATIYQAHTVKVSAALPSQLKLRPGIYRVLVRPAIPSDAGIILGAAIVEKTMRV
jgi:hypothetical protein